MAADVPPVSLMREKDSLTMDGVSLSPDLTV